MTTDFGGGSLGQGWAIAIQPDGKIIVAGDNGYPNNDYCCGEVALARYNTNGSLDTTFDGDGKATTSFGIDRLASARSIVIQPNGKILVAGSSSLGYSDFALARYNANGSLDTTFDGDGKVTTNFSNGTSRSYGHDLALQPDGKIIVTGNSYDGSVTSIDFALARYNTNGSLDITFDGDGKVTTDFGSNNEEVGWAVNLQPDGKLIVAGYSYGTFALARYSSNGLLDTTFDMDGKVTSDFGSNLGGDAVLQPDGKIVVAGGNWNDGNYDFAVARYIGDQAAPSANVGVDMGGSKLSNLNVPLGKSITNAYDINGGPVQ